MLVYWLDVTFMPILQHEVAITDSLFSVKLKSLFYCIFDIISPFLEQILDNSSTLTKALSCD